MRWIYISSHLDDAVFSFGGGIYEQTKSGIEVEVWTLFSGFPDGGTASPLAEKLHFEWGFHSGMEAVQSRRAEDFVALNILGARPVHFGFSDCVYRKNVQGEWLYSDTFVQPDPFDSELVNRMTTALAERMFPGDQIVSPLAIGGHVDHVITRQAVENLGSTPLYYLDIPYILDNPSAAHPVLLDMQADVFSISNEGMKAWQKAAAAYGSQIPMEFENIRKMKKSILSYGREGVSLLRPRVG